VKELLELRPNTRTIFAVLGASGPASLYTATVANLPARIVSAAFALAICYALGFIVTWLLRLQLRRIEQRVYSLLLGAAVTSLVIWCVGMLHALYRGVFAGLFVVSIAGAFAISRRGPNAEIPGSLTWSRWQRTLFFCIYFTFGLSYLLVALAPEASPDGSCYHLGLVSRALRQHAFTPLFTNSYTGMPQGAESIYLIAFAFGGHSAAALVHYAYWMLLPWIVLCLFQRMNRPSAGVVAAILLFTSPLVAMDGTSAYVDVFLMSTAVGAFALTELSIADTNLRFGVAAGVLAGFAMAIKYTAYPVPIYVAVSLAWTQRRSPRSALHLAMAALIGAVVVFSPWTIRNLLFYGNPVFPFANAIFTNPYVHPWSEHLYRINMRSYAGIHSLLQIPLELTVRGDLLQGLIGPVFLLLPIGLLAARFPQGRRMLLAGALLLAPYTQNIGARFFLPPLVFFTCALALALAEFAAATVLIRNPRKTDAAMDTPRVGSAVSFPDSWRTSASFALIRNPRKTDAAMGTPRVGSAVSFPDSWRTSAAFALLCFAAVTSWPSVYNHYCRPNASRIYSFPKKYALGREGDESFLRRQLGDLYEATKLLNEHVAAGTRVLTLQNIPDAYTSAEVATSFQSALGERLYGELLFAAQTHSVARVRFAVAPKTSRFRLIRNRAGPPAWAGICEIDNATALAASPNEFDFSLAADGNLATCWSSWGPSPPDTHFDFSVQRARLTIYVPWDQSPKSWQLLAARTDGSWAPVNAVPEVDDFSATDLRAGALRDLAANDFHYLLTRGEQGLERIIARDPAVWPMHLIGVRTPYRLYQIDPGAPATSRP
jgi:hypothetical protein